MKRDLILLNAFIITLDVITLVLCYFNEHYAKEPTQNIAAAFKLKVEFIVLNQLVDISTQTRLAYKGGGGGRYTKTGLSGGTAKQGKNPSSENNMSAFYEEKSSPSLATDSTVQSCPEPPAAVQKPPPPVQNSTTIPATARRVSRAQCDLVHEVSPFHSNSAVERQSTRYRPLAGTWVNHSSRTTSIWRRMWVALPTGEDKQDS